MHIGLLLSSLAIGGTERQALILARGLAERGHRVTFYVLFEGGALQEEAQASGVECGRLEVVVLVGSRPTHAGLTLLRAKGLLARRLHVDRPAVLLSLDLTGNLLSAWAGPGAGTRVVWSIRESGRDIGWKMVVLRKLGKRLRGRATLAICNSRAGRDACRASGYLPEKSVVIGNGIDVERFRADPAAGSALRVALGVGADELLVGMVGRLTPEKDHANFLRACAEVARSHTHVRFLCAVPEQPDPGEEVRALGQRLEGRLLWHVAGRAIEPVYSALDVFVSPSTAEGFPNTIAEAMACETPCVVTDAGASRDIVGPLGAVVAPGDPASLARAIEELLEANPAERAQLGNESRERIRTEFSVPVMIERTERVLLGP